MANLKKMSKEDILKDLLSQRNEDEAKNRTRFMKAYKGGYGEGDLFLGLRVPHQLKISRKYRKDADLTEIEGLLRNKYHEARYVALSILKERYKNKKNGVKEKEYIVKLYLRNTKHINNWDLVDISAPHITGEYWFNNPSEDLWRFAKSKNLWKERISVLSTFYFIRHKRFDEIVELAEFFLTHEHDLIHKAVGWMLRETGKRDAGVLYGFLDKHHKKMPRTMLRYAIEKLPEKKRRHYMEK